MASTDRENLIRQLQSLLRVALRLRYFSLDVEGTEHLPREGPVVYVQNHAGWFALDSIMVGGAVAQALGVSHTPYYAVQDSALAAPLLGPFFRRLGGLPASAFRNPERLPQDIDAFGICPEGVRGNCKPLWQAYRMREWSRTFVKLALLRNARIVPVAVFGGEECLPVLWTVRMLEPLIGSIVGLPLVPFPLPARWKIVFHPPVAVVPHGPRLRPDRDYTLEVTRQIQATVQKTLDREAPRRPLLRLSSFIEGHASGATG
ncbi:MAG TPA: 1-acyl-sn-glycerol-3-phosphate acyltransferase [Myxococcales bacterium]|nr:1-acyl-sn-glycerol-3-phosphate acyltransferase [Myxococcales bacterium]